MTNEQNIIGSLSRRDWFAGMAIQQVAAGTPTVEYAAALLGTPKEEYVASKHWPKLVAKECVAIADAMIAELDSSLHSPIQPNR